MIRLICTLPAATNLLRVWGFFSPLNWAEITMAQLFLWREMLKNGGEGSSRTKRGMHVAKRFCQKTGRGASEGDANPPTDGTKNVGQTRRLSRKGLLAIQSGDRVREAEGGGGIDRLNMTAGNLLWSQLSAGSQQPNQTRSKWRFEKSGFSTPSCCCCLVIHPRNGSNFPPCPIAIRLNRSGAI